VNGLLKGTFEGVKDMAHKMRRTLIKAAAIIMLLTGPAAAQFPMPGISLQGEDKPKPTPEEIERQKALDNAYKSATKKIPDKNPAADPWGNIRQAPAASSQNK
jgi:hypothetical protein